MKLDSFHSLFDLAIEYYLHSVILDIHNFAGYIHYFAMIGILVAKYFIVLCEYLMLWYLLIYLICEKILYVPGKSNVLYPLNLLYVRLFSSVRTPHTQGL